MTESKFKVADMRCSACVSSVEKAVKKVKGVKECKVALADKSVIVYYENCTIEQIKDSVKKAGYTPREEKKENKLLKIVISAGILVVMMFLMFGDMLSFLPHKFNMMVSPVISFTLCVAVIIINISYYTDGIKKIIKLHPNMSSLVAVGSLASFIYATVSGCIAMFSKNEALKHEYMKNMFFDSSAMIVVIVSIGKYLEERAIGKTRNAISGLLALTPDKAVILTEDGEEKEVEVSSLDKGQIFVLKSGDKICADGIIKKGEIFVDQSAITGESLPVKLGVGKVIRGGTIVVSGYCQAEITALGENTTIGKIIKLVSEAGADKVPIAHLADKVAGIFVPVVFLISLITFTLWAIFGSLEQGINYGVAVLVVSCPCALGLATPLAVMTATGVGASKNVLIKNGASLEYLSKTKYAFFDKTGTLTEGKFQVTDYYYTEDVLSEIASIEKNSSHPIAGAICDYALQNGKTLKEVENFVSVTSCGVQGVIDGKEYKIGKCDYVGVTEGEFYDRYKKSSGSGVTTLIATVNGEPKAVITLSDKIREGVKDVMKELADYGIKTVMLTGDNYSTAERVSHSCGISEFKAEMMPEDKAKVVEQATKNNVTTFVGDGINDAVAMTRATVGVAVGSGTDIAIDSADVIITSSDSKDLVQAVKISKATVRNIKQNLFWAFFYNVIAIPVACGLFSWAGFTFSPMIASVCMSLSSICVVLNALRLKRLK